MKKISRKLAHLFRPPYLILGLVLLFFGENIFPIDGNFIGGVDVARYFFWNAQFIKEQFMSGSIPLWNPYYYSGHPFLANPQTFIFYPFTLLFVFLPLPWAFNLDTLLHIYLAAMGMYCFVFIITQSKNGGVAAAIVYSLNGYFMDNIYAGHLTMVHTAALLPWIFYFVEKAYVTQRIHFFLVAGLIQGLQILSGEPQNNFYTVFFVTVFFFMRDFFSASGKGLKRFRRFGIYLLLVLPVAMGISMIQILPSLEFMSLSDRAKNTFEFATFMSFPPENLFTFFVARPVTDFLKIKWEFAGYFGVLAVVLAGVGGGFASKRQYIWPCLLISLIAITMMLGNYTFFYQFYYNWVPGISVFRVPARCIVIFVFFMSVLVGFGTQQLCEKRLTRKQHGILMVGLIFLSLGLVFWANALQIPLMSKGMLFALGLIVFAFILLNIIRFFKNVHLIAGLIITVLFIDLYLTFQGLTPILNQSQLLKPMPLETKFQQETGFFRVATPSVVSRGMNFHYQGINGYTPISLGSYFYFIHQMANLPIPEERRHQLSPQLFQPDLVFSSKIFGIKYAVVQKRERFQLLKNDYVMPRAVLVKDSIVLPRLEEHIRYLKNPDFNPQLQVVLQKDPYDHLPSILKTDKTLTGDDRVTITQYDPKRIKLRSVSSHNTYLVLSELFYPGWKATVDGNPVPILRANFLLRAIPLKPGQHEIVFHYRPMSFIVGAGISLMTILLLAGFWFISHIKKPELDPMKNI